MIPKQDLDGIASMPSSTAYASSASLRTNAKPNYRPQAADTSIDADIDLFVRLRQLSLKQRVEMFVAHDRSVRKLCLAGIKWRQKDAPIEEIRLLFARAVLAEKFHPDFKPTSVDETMWIQDSIANQSELHQLFESINIPYFVSGGVASSIHGEARSTRDLDLVVSVQGASVDLLVQNGRGCWLLLSSRGGRGFEAGARKNAEHYAYRNDRQR